jgi:hypothetical protein
MERTSLREEATAVCGLTRAQVPTAPAVSAAQRLLGGRHERLREQNGFGTPPGVRPGEEPCASTRLVQLGGGPVVQEEC